MPDLSIGILWNNTRAKPIKQKKVPNDHSLGMLQSKNIAELWHQVNRYKTYKNCSKLTIYMIQDQAIYYYTTLTNFSAKYLVMCKVYTDVGGIKYLYHVCPPVRKIIHSLKLVDYLHVQTDNPWYNYYLYHPYQL